MTQSTKLTQGVVLNYITPTVVTNFIYNNGDTILIVKNDGVAPITLTLDSLELCNQEVDHDLLITIANGTEKAIGVFNRNRFNNTKSELRFDLSTITGITYASVEVLT